MVDKVGESGIGVMHQGMLQSIGWTVQLDVLMHQTIFEFARAAAEQTQLRVWPETTMLDPAPQKEVLSRNPEADGFNFDLAELSAGLDLCVFHREAPLLRPACGISGRQYRLVQNFIC